MKSASLSALLSVALMASAFIGTPAQADDGNPLLYKKLTVTSIQARTGYSENNQHYIVYFNRPFSEHTCSDGGQVGKVDLDGSEQSKMLTNMLTLALAKGNKVDVLLREACSYHSVIGTVYIYP